MVNPEKIRLNEYEYYTCSWNGNPKIRILDDLGKGKYRVQAMVNREWGKPFIRTIEYIFNEYEHARRSNREWQSFERRRAKR